jgi:hypothetical protein
LASLHPLMPILFVLTYALFGLNIGNAVRSHWAIDEFVSDRRNQRAR